MSEEKAAPHAADILTGLLSNPEALSKFSEIISKYTQSNSDANPPLSNVLQEGFEDSVTPTAASEGISDDNSPTAQAPKNAEPHLDFSKIAPLFSLMSAPKSNKTNNQTALLLAVKPYLSPRRAELIDGFVKFSNLGEILSNLYQKEDADVLQQK